MSVGLSVCRSVRIVYCGKTAEWIRMPLGMVSEVGRGMGVLARDGALTLLVGRQEEHTARQGDLALGPERQIALTSKLKTMGQASKAPNPIILRYHFGNLVH